MKDKNYKLKILYTFNVSWFFLSHRLPLARAVKQAGYEVHVAAADNGDSHLIEKEGFIFHPLPFKRSKLGIASELKTLYAIFKLYSKIDPDLIEHATIKPIIYGGIVAKLFGYRSTVNWMTGLGYVFISKTTKGKLLRAIAKKLYSFVLHGKRRRVIFENHDDYRYFIEQGIVDKNNVAIIRGAGVNIDQFKPSPEPPGPVKVILPARMLWDKGVGEFVEAARRFKQTNEKETLFLLVGDVDEDNPSSVPLEKLEEWNQEGQVKWLDKQTDMAKIFADSNIVCLPSYREGMPKALLEAASSARAIVAYDVPGCREIVKDGVNGILVNLKSINGLVEAISKLVNDPDKRKEMGIKGREYVLDNFSEQKVLRETLSLYDSMRA